MGEFDAYNLMEVTAAGCERGYYDLVCGQVVNTPQSVMRVGDRVQLPLRRGIVSRILVGQTSTGKSKKADTQISILVLSYVEKLSHLAEKVVDPCQNQAARQPSGVHPPVQAQLQAPQLLQQARGPTQWTPST